MKKIITFIIFLIAATFFAQVNKTPFPNWVDIVNFSKTPSIDENTLDNGTLLLLYDQQINETKEHSFYRFVTKITENVGVQSVSNIDVLYDPSYEHLEFHAINIIRDGNIIEKLTASDFQIVRKEINSESYIYDGSLSALSNLSDIRVGDIIDYSYSIIGFNPIHKGNFSTSFYLNNTQPLGKLNIKLISSKNLNFNYINTDIEFKKMRQNNSATYLIQEKDISAVEYDVTSPIWQPQLASVFVTSYKDWKEVVDWGVDVFNVNSNLSKELNFKIAEIEKSSKNSGERITKTLNFVQDDIRYLGLESGIGAYMPFSSSKVFKQRYGDCKDKSLLMATMLNKMGIEAYPMLVNTFLKDSITNKLPSPILFNHCVVKVIDNSAGVLWFDPTISNQGGKYDNTVFPDFRYGLVLKKGNNELDQIYSSSNNNFEIIDTFELEDVGKGATLKTKITYFDDQADALRSFFLNNNINTIKKEYENLYAEYFYNIEATENPKYEDDKINNIFTTYQEYYIDSIWKTGLDKNQLTISFYPFSLINALAMPAKRERKLPFATAYPLSRNHKINIKLPQKWNIANDNYTINSENLFYEFDVKYRPSEDLLSLEYFLKTKKDHVTVNEFPEYYDNLKYIDAKITYSLLIPRDGIDNSIIKINSNNALNYLGFSFLLVLFGASIWLTIRVYKYDPEPKLESYFEENKKINGWSILVGIVLCISPFGILFELLGQQGVFLNGSWIQFFNSVSEHYNLIYGIVALSELVVNIFLLSFIILFIFLFFKRRSSFPKLYTYTLIGLCIFLILKVVFLSIFSKINFKITENPMILFSIIKTGIISAYLILSDEVKETFVKRLK